MKLLTRLNLFFLCVCVCVNKTYAQNLANTCPLLNFEVSNDDVIAYCDPIEMTIQICNPNLNTNGNYPFISTTLDIDSNLELNTQENFVEYPEGSQSGGQLFIFEDEDNLPAGECRDYVLSFTTPLSYSIEDPSILKVSVSVWAQNCQNDILLNHFFFSPIQLNLVGTSNTTTLLSDIISPTLQQGKLLNPGSPTPAQAIYLKGDLKLDIDYNFGGSTSDHSKIVMAPGTQIIGGDNNEVLAVAYTDIRGCQKMHDGLLATSGSTFRLFSSSISDGTTGLTTQNNAKLWACDTKFINNYTGVSINHNLDLIPSNHPDTGIGGVFPCFHALKFTGTGALLPPYESEAIPFSGVTVSYSPLVRFDDLILLSNIGIIQLESQFNNLQNGIIARHSNLEINNCFFSNIFTNNNNGLSGNGIFASGTAGDFSINIKGASDTFLDEPLLKIVKLV